LLVPLLLRHNSAVPKFLRLFLLFAFLPALSRAQSSPPYLDPSLPIDQRVNDLISRLTLEEKISQMQDVAPAIPRLDIPAYNWWNEGLHGVARSGTATVFPQAIGLAATWDTDLLHRVAGVISTEARGKYNDAILHHNTGRYYGLTFWSPNINIFRDPRWGRGQETYGEDPFLTARLGVAFVTGLQGDDPLYLKTVSTPKHFAVHSGPESLRHRFDVPVSFHDLYDTYTPAFRATVIDGHANSIMCAYNSVRGEPACANRLLFNLLRNQWGFRGYVVSDCWAINDLYQGHGFVISLDQAAALSLRAGTDLTCGPQFKALDRAADDRLVTPDDIDRAVRRLFEARFLLGMFDPPDRVPWSHLSLADVDTSANRQLALTAARESIVLLKNERNTLPLKSSVKSIAVIGPTADSLDALLGNYNGNPSTYSTILTGIRKRFPNAKITSATGAPITESRAIPIPSPAFRTATSSLLDERAPEARDALAQPVKAGNNSAQSEAPEVRQAQNTASNSIPVLSSPPPPPLPPLPPLPSPPNSTPGLSAKFFSNTTLSGPPTFTRTDPSVDFEWNNVSPAPGVSAEDFSARWTGVLIPPVDGDYRLGVSSEGGSRLYLNDKVFIDDWAPHGERTLTTLVHLQAGHAYPIKLEYFHHSWESAVRLVWLPPNLLEEAVAAARKSDVVIAVVGITAQLEGEESENSDPGFFGGDRTDLTLPRTQQELLEALAATGKPLVVVLTNGSALAVNWANEHAAAILEAWYPGEEGGGAVADVLSGDYNPAGRLPVTFYKSVAQLPPYTDYSMANRTYRYFTEEPLFPFGFGLSYSSFSYSDPAVAPFTLREGSTHLLPSLVPSANDSVGFQPVPEARQTLAQPARAGNNFASAQAPEVRQSADSHGQQFPGDSAIKISARVTNTSHIPGDEVVQLYISHPGLDGAPLRALAGFQRIHLDAHASQTANFVLSPRELSIVDRNGNRVVPAGPVELWLGSGQLLNIPRHPAPNGVSLKFTITTSTPLPN
jgi:beta-glucosidase